MRWPTIREGYKQELESFDEFNGESGEILWEVFQLRVIEHNIRVIAEYYQRIHTSRLCELLDLDELVSIIKKEYII